MFAYEKMSLTIMSRYMPPEATLRLVTTSNSHQGILEHLLWVHDSLRLRQLSRRFPKSRL